MDVSKIPRETRTSVFVLTLSTLGNAATGPFLGVYLEVVRGVALSIIGVVFLTAGVLGIPVQVAAGRLIDSLGPKRVMAIGYATGVTMCLLVALLIATGASTVLILAAYLAYSLSAGLYTPTTSAIIANSAASTVRTGFALLNIGGNVGSAIGPALGGVLAGSYGYSSVFLLCACAWTAAGLSAARWVRSGRIARPIGDGRTDPTQRRSLSWRRDRNMLLLLSLMFCGTFCVFYETTPLILYSAGFLHLSDVQIGSFYTLNGVVIVILQLPLTRLFYTMKRLVTPLLCSVLFAAAGLALAAFASSYTQMLFVMLLLTMGEIFITAPSQTIVALFSSPETRGLYQGYYSAFARGSSFASFIGPASFQVVRPVGLAWGAVSAFALATAVGFGLISRPIQDDYEDLRRKAPGDKPEPASPAGESAGPTDT